MNLVSNSLILSEDQIYQIDDIMNKSNNLVLDFNSIAKISKTFSLMTFILKELIDFSTKKTNKGKLMVSLRKEKLKIENMIQEKEKIIDFLEK